jgi:threonine/homoserine/homoserine lactone efflux protein
MDIAMVPLLKGVLTAFIMTMGVGPGMLINFHTSLKRGFIAGLSVVTGLYASDAAFIAVNYFGVSHLIKSFHHQCAAGIASGAILCIFGISMVLKKTLGISIQSPVSPVPENSNILKGFATGFAVNIVNPFVFIFWTTLMSIATLNFGFHTHPFFIYFAAVIGTALCLDISKSYLFSRLKTGIKAKVMARINHGTGAVLASTGIIIICRSLVVFGQPFHP